MTKIPIARKIGLKEKPYYGRYESYARIRIGRVIYSDYEKGTIDLEWVDNVGTYSKINLTSAFSGQRGHIKTMPEEGNLVICGWRRQTATLDEPVILAYFDGAYIEKHNYQLTRAKASSNLQDISTIQDKIGFNIVRQKARKVYPGEIDIESSNGAEVYLDDNVLISDSKLSEIEINSNDQSIRMSSLQQYSSSEAARTWNGMITRQPLQGNEFISPTVLPDGQKVYIATDSQNPFHLGGKPYTEYRIEAYHKGDGILNVNEVNAGMDITNLSPDVTFIIGTNVGNDATNINRYAKILRPQVFGTQNDTTPTVDDLGCLPEEYDTLASAFQLKFRSGTKIDIDKQGHFFTNFAASTAQHPLGNGRSWESNFDGAIKWLVGKDNLGHSVIIDTFGSTKETYGVEAANLRSIETTTQGGIYTRILAPDKNGNAIDFSAQGNVAYNVNGNYFVTVSGDYKITVTGKITEEVLGTKIENYLNDKSNVYGGSYKETIIKDKQVTIGESQTVTIAGTKNAIPVVPTTVVDFLEIMTGSMEIKTLLGNVKINSVTQQVEVNGLLKVKLGSGVKIELIAPSVDIGQLPVRGGVITTLTHLDYVTGAPLIGSQTVKASS